MTDINGDYIHNFAEWKSQRDEYIENMYKIISNKNELKKNIKENTSRNNNKLKKNKKL